MQLKAKYRCSAWILVAVLLISLAGCGWTGDGDFFVKNSQKTVSIDDNYLNFYEIFVYSFCDSDGDGIGDLNGVASKLDYVKEMGFNAIWLMPVMPSATYHKYDVKDYLDIDPVYGNLEDFQNLCEECHKRDIKLVIDMVLNHSADLHPWFKEACAYLRGLPEDGLADATECPYVDYYHFAKEKPAGKYEKVPGISWYYEAEFSGNMPDLNLANQDLREEIRQIADFWIDLGVDGFRMDAAMHYEESNTAYNNEFLNWLYEYCLTKNPNFYMVSEVWAAESAIAGYYESLTPSMFNFDAAGAEGKIIRAAQGSYNASKFVEACMKYQNDFSAANPDYIDAVFITNHDMTRVANVLQDDEQKMKMACAMMMTMSGNVFVYYGEEIGMSSKGTKDENKRIPMIWSETDTEGMTRGPIDADRGITSAFPAVDEQLKDSHSLLNFYKNAMAIRNSIPEISRGKIEVVENLTDGHLAVIRKTWQDSSAVIIYNTSKERAEITLTETELEGMKCYGKMITGEEDMTYEKGVLSMPAMSVCILK